MAQVFLSYDREDAPKAEAVATALEHAGHEVWWDRHILGGTQYSQQIEQALDDADAVVVLWSAASAQSAWVRDEAAAGRDSNRLVPVLVEAIKPPMGFRQYQSIDLSNWQPRRKSRELDALYRAVAGLSPLQASPPAAAGRGAKSGAAKRPARPVAAPARPAATSPRPALPDRALAIAAAVLLLLGAGGAWYWFGASRLPVVEVAAGDSTARSQAAANDLFVKLGSLAQVGGGKWQLVDASSREGSSDFVFRTADRGSERAPRVNLVLLDGRKNALLWSREFTAEPGAIRDLRQQSSLTAGRVLGCALESRAAGGLRPDLFKLFLDSCAGLDEQSYDDSARVAGQLRSIFQQAPKFEPVAARLILADINAADFARLSGSTQSAPMDQLKADVAKIRENFPDLPDLALAELRFAPDFDFRRNLELLRAAVAHAPDSSQLVSELGSAWMAVGRLLDSVSAAKRAAELDPLSPMAAANYVLALAQAGQLDMARSELAKAESQWGSTAAIVDAKWGFHMRYGDPRLALTLPQAKAGTNKDYLATRLDPTPARIADLRAGTERLIKEKTPGYYGIYVQALAEFKQTDLVFALIAATPTREIAEQSYLLFRPAFATVRADPRFMAVAARIGLVRYWRSSGNWPDFCGDAGLPYDCQSEAAKYAH